MNFQPKALTVHRNDIAVGTIIHRKHLFAGDKLR